MSEEDGPDVDNHRAEPSPAVMSCMTTELFVLQTARAAELLDDLPRANREPGDVRPQIPDHLVPVGERHFDVMPFCRAARWRSAPRSDARLRLIPQHRAPELSLA